ncbi:hypothetical protein QBC39DRAFT_141876 [Podospora conica]|nr:hypothetical protein QBC39DRAFT_141876 [Schizothecium conicum]
MKVIVIGGGPAGLVTLKFLATAHQFYPELEPIDVQLFEAEDDIGGTFKYRVWDKSEVRIPYPLTYLQVAHTRLAGLVKVPDRLLGLSHRQRVSRLFDPRGLRQVSPGLCRALWPVWPHPVQQGGLHRPPPPARPGARRHRTMPPDGPPRRARGRRRGRVLRPQPDAQHPQRH